MSKTVDELVQVFKNNCEKVEQAKLIGPGEEKTIYLSNQLCKVSIRFSTLWQEWMIAINGKNCTTAETYSDYATAKSVYDSIVGDELPKTEPKKTELIQMHYYALDGWLTTRNKVRIGWKRLLCSIRRKHDMKHVGHFVDQNTLSEIDFYTCAKCGLKGVIYLR